MRQFASHQATVDKLYSLYREKGFICDDEALAMMKAAGLSLVAISRITDKLISLGVVFLDRAAINKDRDNDYAQIDYETLYTEVLKISPEQQPLIDYVRNVRPPQQREWQQLITQMNSGNEYAFSRLFEMYLRVVVRIATSAYKKKKFELADGIQEGTLGLIRGIEAYDLSKHGALVSYVSFWIQQYIDRAINNQGRTIRLPTHACEAVQELRRSQKSLFYKLRRKPSFVEIAADTKKSVELVRNLLISAQEPIPLATVLEDSLNDDVLYRYFAICKRQVVFQFCAARVFPSFREKNNNYFSFRNVLNDFPSRLNILA